MRTEKEQTERLKILTAKYDFIDIKKHRQDYCICQEYLAGNKETLRGTIDKNLKRSLMVLGPTGVGKSEMIHQVAASYGMRIIDVRLLLWSLTDLKGIPYPDDTHTYTFKLEDTAELVFATPRSWQAVGNLLDAGLDSEVLRIKVEGNVGVVETTNFLKYLENTEKLPNIEMILNGRYLNSKKVSKYISSIDVYYLLLQNLVYAISAEFRKKSDKWRLYMENSIDFICTIINFPLELKKSYVDQLCKINSAIKEYIYNESRNQNMSKVLQELDYII